MENKVLNDFKVDNKLVGDQVLSLLIDSQIEGSCNGQLSEGVYSMMCAITPDLAKILLENCNNNNRPLDKINYTNLKNAMLNGEWIFDGTPIQFDSEGNLINGQHRLTAVILADMYIPFMVIFGLNNKAFKVIDTGKNRGLSDVFAIDGIPNYRNASATTKFLYNFNRGVYDTYNGYKGISNTEALNYYKTLENISESVKFGVTLFGTNSQLKVLPAKYLCGFHYLFSKVDKEAGEDFLNQLFSGIGLEVNSPILVLRNKILLIKSNKNLTLTTKELIKNIIYCWNKWRDGEKIQKIKLPTTQTLEIQ